MPNIVPAFSFGRKEVLIQVTNGYFHFHMLLDIKIIPISCCVVVGSTFIYGCSPINMFDQAQKAKKQQHTRLIVIFFIIPIQGFPDPDETD